MDFRVSSSCSFGNCVEVGRSPEGTVVVRHEVEFLSPLVFRFEPVLI